MSRLSNSKIGVIIPSKFESEMIGTPHHVSGMGKVDVACAIYDLVNKGAEKILLTGFCGGFRGVKIGEVVEPWYFVDGDYDASPLEPWPRQATLDKTTEYTCISQDRFLKKNPYSFSDVFDKLVTDMESYSAVRVCSHLNIPIKVIKIVSDIVGENSEKDFLESCKKLSGKLEQEILNATRS